MPIDNKLEAENLSLRQLLKEYREDHVDMYACEIGARDSRCRLCRKYDALESK